MQAKAQALMPEQEKVIVPFFVCVLMLVSLRLLCKPGAQAHTQENRVSARRAPYWIENFGAKVFVHCICVSHLVFLLIPRDHNLVLMLASCV